MGKLTARGVDSRIRRKGRYGDGEGLHLRVFNPGKGFWVYRYRVNLVERETSLGSYPTMSLADARIKHTELRTSVLKGIDPLAKRDAKGVVVPSGKPTFGQCATAYVAAHEESWKSGKHARQWSQTLRTYCGDIRDMPVDQVDTEHVLAVLRPIWATVPETASRVRARIEVVLASAAVAGHIDPDKPNPARWAKWLDLMLPSPKKVGKPRGSHAAMPHASVRAFMARLAGIDNMAARALEFLILTATRTSETLNATWDEVDFQTATWVVPKERMKMGKPHRVPLSAPALAILRDLHERSGANPYVFAGRPQRPLSSMSMAMLLRRMGAGDITIHGFRSSFRDWTTEIDKTEYATAERCLAHTIGNSAALSYDRSDRLELRRPVMESWSRYVTETADNAVPLRPFARADA